MSEDYRGIPRMGFEEQNLSNAHEQVMRAIRELDEHLSGLDRGIERIITLFARRFLAEDIAAVEEGRTLAVGASDKQRGRGSDRM